MASPEERTLVERYRSARSDPELVVLEGLHALKHALRFGAETVDLVTGDAAALHALALRLAPDLADTIARLARPIPDSTFGRLAPSPHPTGMIALARRPIIDLDVALEARLPTPIVLLDRPTHHGNIGAVIRVAAAAGAAGVLVTGDHDPWHPASIRGAAGLQFALPVGRLGAAPATDRPLVAVDPSGEPVDSRPVPPRAVLIFGSERSGIEPALLERADRRVAIPMRAGVSSLNLATAVAVMLYTGAGAPPVADRRPDRHG